MIISGIITLILAILGIVSFLLIVLGIPVGIVLLIIYLQKNKKERTKKLLTWIIVCFSGIPLIIVTFVFWAVFQFFLAIFGLSPLTSPDMQPLQ